MPENETIDVEKIVADARERVARERAEGLWEDADELAGLVLKVPPAQAQAPVFADGFDLGGSGPRIRFRPELGFSSKRVVGPLITGVKRLNLRLLFYVLDDLARQADAAVARLEAALAAEAAARESATTRLESATTRLESATEAEREALRAEVAVREVVERDVQAVSERVAALEAALDRLQLGPRLARLERRHRASSVPVETTVASGLRPAALTSSPLDYLAFEARFRPEASVYERLAAYLGLLRGRERVVDLGCGRGELLELLRDEGVPAYGVDIDPDFVALVREKEIEVVQQDALDHLESLEPGAVDGIVSFHLVEHLPGAAVARLISLATDRLADGGILIVETPNPESLVAGSVNFHRDLTHVRPIHPDTLAFLCDTAGLADVEVLRLSPVPERERLPEPGDDGPLAPIVERLNGLLYGFQDYAVVARK